MKTLYTRSPDNQQIAYSLSGSGPSLVLLHGGGSSREIWGETGYLDALGSEFTLITPDLRGHGESAKPTDPADYTEQKMTADILAVADACGAETFYLLGMSFGAKLARYLGAGSDRVEKLVMMATLLGQGTASSIRQQVLEFTGHWQPLLSQLNDGELEEKDLEPDDRETLEFLDVPVVMAWGQAMLDWGEVEAKDFLCPTLWLVGDQDQGPLESYQAYQDSLPGSKVRARILAGLDHPGTLTEIDQTLPLIKDFLTG